MTTITSLIHHRAAAILFDSEWDKFDKQVRALRMNTPSASYLQKIYVLFSFDSKETGLFNRFHYKKREMSAGIHVLIEAEEFMCLEPAAIERFFFIKLLIALQYIKSKLEPPVGNEMDSLIQAVQELGQVSELPAIPLSINDSSAKSEAFAYQLVLQFPEAELDDLDSVPDWEERLSEALAELGEVDGNDIGMGKLNLFILTDHPGEALFAALKQITRWKGIHLLGAGCRALNEDDYKRVWPVGSKAVFEL